MSECDTIPRGCAEEFKTIAAELASIRKTGEATHEQAAKTNGHVAELFRTTGQHDTDIACLKASQETLASQQKEQRSTLNVILNTGWKIAAAAVCGWLGIDKLVDLL